MSLFGVFKGVDRKIMKDSVFIRKRARKRRRIQQLRRHVKKSQAFEVK